MDPGKRRSQEGSLLRSLLESCSGILTGSDTPRDAPLSRHLAAFGLAGEGVTDGRVWVVKSHWPERKGFAEVKVHAGVLLVRSPLDAIDSYWHFVLSQSHTDSVKDSEYARLADEWKELRRGDRAARYIADEWEEFKRGDTCTLCRPTSASKRDWVDDAVDPGLKGRERADENDA